jgi:amino acid transporter
VLLNTTSKKVAAIAGCLSLLSYMATGVVSAASAISYLQYILSAIPTSAGVIVLLGFFAAMVLWGIKDSASLAYAILLLHMGSMAALIISMVVWLCRHPSEQQFSNNVHSDVNPSVPRALLFGYASAMLGITGFETSANFVEEQQDGVFVKTLRNMWILVSILNPTLSLLAVLVVPLDSIVADANVNVLLAYLGDVTGGAWLKYLISIDAFLVLAASVLTAYVGMNGLARRLALDRGLPQVLLSVNRWRQTNHWIILAFLLICISLYFIVNGDTDSLGNVYSISFLLVMSGFAIGNMLLKYNRGQLKREVRASWSRGQLLHNATAEAVVHSSVLFTLPSALALMTAFCRWCLQCCWL